LEWLVNEMLDIFMTPFDSGRSLLRRSESWNIIVALTLRVPDPGMSHKMT